MIIYIWLYIYIYGYMCNIYIYIYLDTCNIYIYIYIIYSCMYDVDWHMYVRLSILYMHINWGTNSVELASSHPTWPSNMICGLLFVSVEPEAFCCRKLNNLGNSNSSRVEPIYLYQLYVPIFDPRMMVHPILSQKSFRSPNWGEWTWTNIPVVIPAIFGVHQSTTPLTHSNSSMSSIQTIMQDHF